MKTHWKCKSNQITTANMTLWLCIGESKQTKVINFLLETRETRSKMWKKQHIHRTSNSSRIKWGAIFCSAMTLEFCRESVPGEKYKIEFSSQWKRKKSTADYRKIKSFGVNCVKIQQASPWRCRAVETTEIRVLWPVLMRFQRIEPKHKSESQFKLI